MGPNTTSLPLWKAPGGVCTTRSATLEDMYSVPLYWYGSRKSTSHGMAAFEVEMFTEFAAESSARAVSGRVASMMDWKFSLMKRNVWSRGLDMRMDSCTWSLLFGVSSSVRRQRSAEKYRSPLGSKGGLTSPGR